MIRLLIKYAKEGPARFLSHLEVMRTFERACRRARLPLKYSGGYNPRPHLSFAAPLGVGVSSRAELVEVGLERPIPPEEVREKLSPELPEGFSVVEVAEIPAWAPALMSRVRLASYEIDFQPEPYPGAEELAAKTRQFLRQEHIPVVRETPKGRKEKNIRPGIYGMQAALAPPHVTVDVFLAAGSEGHIRPDELLEAYLHFGGWRATDAARICRTGLYAVDLAGRIEELESFCRKK